MNASKLLLPLVVELTAESARASDGDFEAVKAEILQHVAGTGAERLAGGVMEIITEKRAELLARE